MTKNEALKQDIYAVCGAVMPIAVQVMSINPQTFVDNFNIALFIGMVIKAISLAYMGVLYNRIFCKDIEPSKVFFNGMAAPSVMLAVVAPFVN
jgi:hypothetical protein